MWSAAVVTGLADVGRGAGLVTSFSSRLPITSCGGSIADVLHVVEEHL
jgi:hypothetical protein